MESNKISSPQGTQPAHAARSRSTANAEDAANTDGGGFLALLAALGAPGQGEEPVVELAAAGDASQGAGPDPQDMSSLVAWQNLLPPGFNANGNPATAQGGQEGTALSAVASAGAAPSGLGLPGAGAQGGAASFAGAAFGADGLPQGLVGETAMLDASGGLVNGAPQRGVTSQGRILSRVQNAMALKGDAVELSAGRQQLGANMQVSSGQLGTAVSLLQATAERAVGSPALGSVDRGMSGPSGLTAESGFDVALAAGGAPVALATGGGSGGGRPGEARSGGSAGFEGAGASAPAEMGSLDGATVFADPTQAGLEEHLTEQVAYWVNQKTQNAELTLDRDGQPVEVSVTLSGNEAHVSFRTDQLQTRELLDKSMAQLSELLRSEGLVLSGMSVGTSAGQRDQGGGTERQSQRDGSRQTQVAAAAPTGSASLLRGSSPDRAVDVFV